MGSGISGAQRRWIIATVWGIGIALLCIGYNYLRSPHISWYIANKSLAFSALFLILISHALSGTVYFWGLGRSVLGYRKALGVVGFGIGLVHAGLSTSLYTNGFSSLTFFSANIVNILAALAAIGLFAYMVVISNFGMPAKLGALRWRRMLRICGYTGIILVTIHLALFSYPEWKYWFSTFKPLLPPLNLVLVFASAFTLTLRVFLSRALAAKKQMQNSSKKEQIPTPGPPPIQKEQPQQVISTTTLNPTQEHIDEYDKV